MRCQSEKPDPVLIDKISALLCTLTISGTISPGSPSLLQPAVLRKSELPLDPYKYVRAGDVATGQVKADERIFCPRCNATCVALRVSRSDDNAA